MPRPSADQLLIEYEDAQRRTLRNLQLIRLGNAQARWLLTYLALVIGPSRRSYDLTIAQLVNATEIGRTKLYECLRQLRDAGLVIVDDLPHTNRKRFQIVYSNLDESATESPQTTEQRTDAKPSAIRMADSSVRDANEPVRNTDGSVRIADSTTIHPHLIPTIPTKNPPHEGGEAEEIETEGEIISTMTGLGVAAPVAALDQARSRGCSLAHLADIVDHFAEVHQQHGLGPGALHNRIRNAHPALPVTEGWPPPSITHRPRSDNLEAKHGATLDRMTPTELAELITSHGSDVLRSFFRDDPHAERLVRSERIHFLKALERKTNAPATTATGNLTRI